MYPTPMSTPRPPYNDRLSRRAAVGGSAGGPVDPPGQGREIVPGVVNGEIREGTGANTWDRYTSHERMPWYDHDYMIGNANTLVDWTRCGPVRPSLHMLQATVRKLVGTDNTRAFDPRPIRTYGTQDQGHGMHSNPPYYKPPVNSRYRVKVQQQSTNVNRLTVARYTGQSYSQTTRMQGSG